MTWQRQPLFCLVTSLVLHRLFLGSLLRTASKGAKTSMARFFCVLSPRLLRASREAAGRRCLAFVREPVKEPRLRSREHDRSARWCRLREQRIFEQFANPYLGASPSYSRRWRRRRADFPLMVGCAVARCVCFAAASGLGVGAGGSRGWIAGAMVAPSLMALSASTPPRCGGSTRPLGRQQQRRGGRGKPSRQPARRASKAAGEWC